MGVSRSGAELAGKLKNASANLKAAEGPAVKAGGQVVALTFKGAIAAMGAGGSRGATVITTNTTSNGHPAVSNRFGPNPGWVSIMEGRVGPYFEAPTGKGRGGSLKRQNMRKGNRRATGAALSSLFGGSIASGTKSGVLNLGGGIGPKAWAFHKGTNKKKPFVAAGMRAAPPLAATEMRQKTLTEFAKSFR